MYNTEIQENNINPRVLDISTTSLHAVYEREPNLWVG